MARQSSLGGLELSSLLLRLLRLRWDNRQWKKVGQNVPDCKFGSSIGRRFFYSLELSFLGIQASFLVPIQRVGVCLGQCRRYYRPKVG